MRSDDGVSEQERELLDRGFCPTCARRGFVLGPKGGLSLNIECANLGCRDRFNVALFAGRIQQAQRIAKRADGGLPWPSEPLQ